MKPPRRASTLLFLAIALSTVGTLLANSITGPSSSQSPYVLRSQPGVVLKSIFTVGDSVNLKPDGVTPYRMVGIPDGLGAFDNGDGTFTLLMNHEIPNPMGIPRAHGRTGAFVSRWIINKSDLRVVSIRDFIGNTHQRLPEQQPAVDCLASLRLPGGQHDEFHAAVFRRPGRRHGPSLD